MSRLLKFEKLRNTRDLGGMRTQDGGTLAGGKLIRSGHLAEISERDAAALSDLVCTVIDFRTDGEQAEKPDAILPGAAYYHIPVMDSLTAGITREEQADRDVFSTLLFKPAEAKRYMCSMYRAFAMSEFSVSQYEKFIRHLLHPHGKAVLWHCTAGKDRAGVASAIVEELLGVSREDIIADYMQTNRYLAGDIRFLTDYVKKQAGTDSRLTDESLGYLFGADREFILSFYQAVDEKFGGFAAFAKYGLTLSDSDVEHLRSVYLAPCGE